MPCGPEPPDALYAPEVVVGEVYAVKMYHQVMGCYGVVRPDWTIDFDRLRGGELDHVTTYDVAVHQGMLAEVTARWLPGDPLR